MTAGVADAAPAGGLVVCEVVRRGRFIVAERFFEPGAPLTLGRRGSVPVEAGDLVVVRPERGRARVVERLGSPRDVIAVLRGLLVESGVAWAPPPDALAEARRVAREPEGLDAGRVDLRHLPAVTVDPPTARDFDDAFSVAPEGDGVRLWVHIADVAHHVRPGGALDREARRRGFSVYVPGQVEPMLPHELSSGACSLQEGRDRRAVTVEVLLDAQLRPGEPNFYRSLIRSRARLSYNEAHEILEGRQSHPVAGDLLALADRVAVELRRRRFARGALAIEPRELAFTIDEGRVVAAGWETEPRAHALIEELMILANELVAGFLVRVRRPAIFRVHELPEPEAVELLLKRLADLGVPTVPLPESLDPQEAMAVVAAQAERVRAYIRKRPGGEAFTTLVLRALKQARYDTENLGHAGLASPAYAHFTSPIRRYPDLVVHRALCAAIGAGEEQPGGDLQQVAAHASLAEREAAVVERRGDDLCLAFLLRDRLMAGEWERPFRGEVVGLIGAGLFMRFWDVFEGFLPSRRIAGGDRLEPNELNTALVGLATGRRFRLGDELSVKVVEIDAPRGRVTLDLPGADFREDRRSRPPGEADRRRGRPGPVRRPPRR